MSGSPPPSFGLGTVQEESSEAAREKSLALHLEHVFLHEGAGGDGDATPRRRPSPPPPIRTDSLEEEEEPEGSAPDRVEEVQKKRVVDDSALLHRSGERDRAVLGFTDRRGNNANGR
jgi:hypothetical protein